MVYYGQILPSIRAMMLNGNVHHLAPVTSASTQNNTAVQQQIVKRIAAAPIMSGVLFLIVNAGGTATGLAGTLPAYSVGGGGGYVVGL